MERNITFTASGMNDYYPVVHDAMVCPCCGKKKLIRIPNGEKTSNDCSKFPFIAACNYRCGITENGVIVIRSDNQVTCFRNIDAYEVVSYTVPNLILNKASDLKKCLKEVIKEHRDCIHIYVYQEIKKEDGYYLVPITDV